jgi:hypothetical protein
MAAAIGASRSTPSSAGSPHWQRPRTCRRWAFGWWPTPPSRLARGSSAGAEGLLPAANPDRRGVFLPPNPRRARTWRRYRWPPSTTVTTWCVPAARSGPPTPPKRTGSSRCHRPDRRWLDRGQISTRIRTRRWGHRAGTAGTGRQHRIGGGASPRPRGRLLIDDPAFSCKLADARIRTEVLEILEYRVQAALSGGGHPGAASSMLKVLSTELSQALTELAMEAAEPAAAPTSRTPPPTGWSGRRIHRSPRRLRQRRTLAGGRSTALLQRSSGIDLPGQQRDSAQHPRQSGTGTVDGLHRQDGLF